ncbi:MAG: hypothetical protein IJW13_03685 [Clostridia bacterium]|nr:hypothetical protein [Clostridia bacterium]
MSVFSTKTLILRPFSSGFGADGGKVNGLLKCEKNKNEHLFCLLAVNFAPLNNGNYAIVISDQNKNMRAFELENPPCKQYFNSEGLELAKGFAALVLFFDGKTVTPVAFGSLLDNIVKISEFTKFYAEKAKDKKTKIKNGESETKLLYDKACENEKIAIPFDKNKSEKKQLNNELLQQNLDNVIKNYDQNDNFAPTTDEQYDDDAIALTDYYGEEKNIKNEAIDERIFKENDFDTNSVKAQCETKKTEELSHDYEEQTCACKGEEPKYYYSVKDKIDRLFENHPPFYPFSSLIPQSEWVKIPYPPDGHYVVGVIKEMGQVCYLVYGVPGVKSKKPKGFENYCVFLPENIFEPENKGYWCLFQSAVDGKQITQGDN